MTWSDVKGYATELTFLDTTIAEKSARAVELTDLIGKRQEILNELLGDASTSADRIAILQSKLVKLQAEFMETQTKISRARTRRCVKVALEEFKPRKPVKILEIGDLVAIELVASLRKHTMLQFRLGASARDPTTLIRVARFMGIKPSEGLPEMACDRVYALMPNSNEIRIVDEGRRNRR